MGSISGVPHGNGRLGQGRKRRNLDRNRSAEVTGHNSTAAHVAAKSRHRAARWESLVASPFATVLAEVGGLGRDGD